MNTPFTIGNSYYWIFNRLGGTLFGVLGLGAFWFLREMPAFAFLALALGLLQFVVLYPIALVSVTEDEIIIRRWIVEHRVPWRLVESVEYYPFRFPELRIRLNRFVGGTRSVHVPSVVNRNPSLRDAWNIATKKSVPEEVVWLKQKVLETQAGRHRGDERRR